MISNGFLLLFVFLAGGCKAQSAAKPAPLTSEAAQRIEAALRAQYNVPRSINIALSELKPSDQPGYDQVITATGGVGATTFAVTSGTLPPGLTLASNGELTGTPTNAVFPLRDRALAKMRTSRA